MFHRLAFRPLPAQIADLMNPPIAFAQRLVFRTLLVVLIGYSAVGAAELLPPGFRPLPLGIHALTGAKVVIKPGEELPVGIVIIRDGLIQSVGRELPIPADARVWDLTGSTIYAGFIEPHLVLNAAQPPVSSSEAFPVTENSLAAGGRLFYGAPGVEESDVGSNRGPGYPGSRITPEYRAVDHYFSRTDFLAPLRELGFTAAVIAPSKGIIRGSSSLIALSDEHPNSTVLKFEVFQHIAFDTSDNDKGLYPSSLMGVIASIRQTFLDAQHYELEQKFYTQRAAGRKRPGFNPALQALAPVMHGRLPVVFEAGSALMNERAAQLGREFGLNFSLVASGEEWRRPDRISGTAATWIVPVNFPSIPKLPSEEDWDQISLNQLRAWDWAPENPSLLRQKGMTVALTTHGLSDKKSFRKNLQLALDRGFSETDALAALTTVPAKLCGVENSLGTIEPGKLANLVVVSGSSYFDPESKVRAVWIDGRIYPVSPDDLKPVKPGQTAPDSNSPPAKEELERHAKPPEIAEARTETNATPSTNAPAADVPEDKNGTEKLSAREIHKRRVARSPLEGRGGITNSASILIRNATIWTSGPAGILTNAQLLIADGKVQQAGYFQVESGPETLVIDATGLHVAPGIVDCHSHAAILGNANETGSPSTSMVRLADVVNSESDNIYEQLAGGVTTINLLHGSANPIGGQNCVIKLRDGLTADELIFSNAPAGIKFALGENVKQANWGDKFRTRFPQTRMGVRTFIQNRFIAARQYLSEWENYRNPSSAPDAPPPPPRRDLELEALGEILNGRRWIHCHAYRQDEMLMLTRLMQDFGVQIGTFQHALEAYKIADELATANIGVSTFSDWWGFKFELFDAIPYNGSLCRERGVLVSFNSDFSELGRRLNLEAAKAVKYGDVPEAEAWKFITLNPAKQLRVDQYVGSLEPGKDADFAVWSKSPLDSGSVCLQTWIDGTKYFDRELDKERTERLRKEREELIAKAKKMADHSGSGTQVDANSGKSFFHISLEHENADQRCEHE